MATEMMHLYNNKVFQLLVSGLLGCLLFVSRSCDRDFSLRKPHYENLPSFVSDTVWFVVENAAGSLPKMRYDSRSRGFRKNSGGEVQFLPLPANQGFLPREGRNSRTDWPDAILLAEAIGRGRAVKALPVAVLHLRESGHRKDIVVCIPLEAGERLLPIEDFSDLMIEGEAVRRLLELWYRQHLGYGRVQVEGWGEVE